MFRYLPLVLKNSWRNRRRSILTIGSVAVSLCILCVLVAMYGAMFHAEVAPAEALRLVCRNRMSLTQPIPSYFKDRIQRIPGVHDVMVWEWFGGVYKDARDPNNMFPRFAADPAHLFSIRSEYHIPSHQKMAFQRERTGCVVSKALADKMRFNLGDRITLVGDIFPVTLVLKVVGIFDEPENVGILWFSREYLREALGAGSAQQDMVGAFLIQADRAENVPRIAEAVDRSFETSPFPTRTESEKAFELSFLAFVGNLKLFIMAIFSAVTFTILLVSGNTVSMSVRERTREVGILKTLGFTPGAILGIIVGEAALMSAGGGVIGCALAEAMCSLIGSRPANNLMPALRTLGVTPVAGGISVGIALLIGLASSLVPAWNASRTSILDSLRHIG